MKTNNKLPVKLRQKPTKKGYSLYLEINHKGKTEKRYLRLYLLDGATAQIKAYNANIMERAKAEQAKAIIALTNGENAPQNKGKRMSLQELIAEVIENKKKNKKSNGTIVAYNTLLLRLNIFLNNKKISLQKVDVRFCQDFVLYLKDSKVLNNNRNRNRKGSKDTYTNKELSKRSANKYLVLFKTILKYAVCQGYISKSPMMALSDDYAIKFSKEDRGYLTEDEVIRIEEIKNFPRKEIQRAFLFACYCGLRISDIKSLTIDDIRDIDGSLSVYKKMKKTNDYVNVPLCKKALSYLGTPDNKGLFFNLPDERTINYQLMNLTKSANISKKVTFHISRHTFATMLLTKGADLYTTSKLLGHKNIGTTQIYADIVQKKRESAISLLD